VRRLRRLAVASLGLLAAVTLSSCATVPGQDAPPDAQRERLRAVVDDVRARSFPDLQDATIAVEVLEHDEGATFFALSNFGVIEALGGARRYQILLSRRLLELDVNATRPALFAVVAHELSHTVDYEERDAAGLFSLLPMLWDERSEEQVEKRTDLEAIARGYGSGLIAYRRWQKSVLDDHSYQQKLQIYYDPVEIELIEAALRSCRGLRVLWRRDPPLTARQVVQQTCLPPAPRRRL
jgi:hypothetical protein